MNIKYIYIFGVGGIGGFIGSRIVEGTKSQPDIKTFFVARGKHKEAIEKNGLLLEFGNEQVLAYPAQTTEDPENLPQPDVCFLCVKSYDLESSCLQLKKKIYDHTVIIPVLNGIDIYERMRKILDQGFILPGCVYMNAFVKEPGVIKHLHNDLVVFGKDPQQRNGVGEEVFEFLNEIPGIRFKFQEDPYPAIWEKYMFVAAYALVTAYSRLTIRQVYEDEVMRKMVLVILNEINSIALKKGYVFPGSIADELAERGGRLPPDAVTSYQRDLALKNGRNEGDIFGETIIRMGNELGVPAPVTLKIYNGIQTNYKF
jgi:2-dehydropantoate 2-reductase